MDLANLQKQSPDRYLINLAWLTALATAIFFLENLIPKPLPFLKLGLANIIVLILLISNNWRSALIVAFAKIFFGNLISGTFFSITTILSFSGTFFSLLIMTLLIKFPLKFSVLGISVGGAVGHNIGQILVVRILLIKNETIFYLTPVLIVMGIATGLITGYLAKIFIDNWKEKNEEKT
jgi:heptaprenyl diphosphate synthase